MSVLENQILPIGDGYMPLSCAAYWIASSGDTIPVDHEDIDSLEKGYQLALEAAAAGRLAIIGMTNSESEKIPPYLFADCKIDFPYDGVVSDLDLSPRSYLRACIYSNEQEWEDGFCDEFLKNREVAWTRLMVSKAEVLSIWAFGENHRTGMAGRPSKSKDLILAEFERRVSIGAIEETKAEQARVLADWLKKKHSGSPVPQLKTLKNALTEPFNRARQLMDRGPK